MLVDDVPDPEPLERVESIRHLEEDHRLRATLGEAPHRAQKREGIGDVLEHVATTDEVGLRVSVGVLERTRPDRDGRRQRAGARGFVRGVKPESAVPAEPAEEAEKLPVAAPDLDDRLAAQPVALD